MPQGFQRMKRKSGSRSRLCGRFIYRLRDIFRDRTGLLTNQTKFIRRILLFLPHDTVRRKTFKYALVIIDVASRYKDAEPLTSKESSEVAKSFEKIYSRKLKWPERIIIDPGKEFMGRVTSLMKRHNVIIQRSEAGNHRAQAFVERANRTLSERLFSFQYGKEMRSDDNERSREWVERLPAVLKSMNNEVTRLTGKEPLEVLSS